ncbi:chaperonin 10-like protein [Ilyonectria robusta]|uniref:chaperonin 10-like protein n=1 Tax=Ilyonectria robusta TaxID=1079257 RepID=UPI001E8E5BE2|nr:chaperonin 10-like protein [Ilyonectria robusta]KAH8665395.1 chaperonin 10-like protein [Ilyonectria robusta]
MVQNEAAWITSPSEYPFTVKEGPNPTAGAGEIVIKNAAVSINPVDWKIQTHGSYLSRYPFILGEDAAGFVEEVGAGVTRFKKGDRVVAHCHGLMTRNPANSAFQTHPVATSLLASPIPESMSFEQAVVLPLAISTASAGLYPRDRLNLPLPSATKPEKNGKTVLIWGGASSVGATAIQLAAASGATVITTASPANHKFVESLGADMVFDYRSSTVVEDISSVLSKTDFVGVYDAIGEDPSFDAVSAILDRLNKKVPVASVLPCNNSTELFAPVYVVAFAIIQEPNQHIGEWIWEKFLPEALANDSFQAKPDPAVTGHGLKDIQNALDVQRKGVSAKKIVVIL